MKGMWTDKRKYGMVVSVNEPLSATSRYAGLSTIFHRVKLVTTEPEAPRHYNDECVKRIMHIV